MGHGGGKEEKKNGAEQRKLETGSDSATITHVE